MWELIEGMFYYLKSKNKQLPTFISLSIIGLTLLFYFLVFIHSNEPNPTAPIVDEAPLVDLSQEEMKAEPKKDSKPIPQAVVPPVKEEHAPRPLARDEAPPLIPNIAHAKAAVIDALKVEGIDSEVTLRILTHMRSQLHVPENEAVPLVVSVRHVLGPDVSEEEVNRITSIMIKTFEDSFNYVQSR